MNHDVLLTRARMLYTRGRYDMAEEAVRQALALSPDNAEAHSLLAMCLKNNRDRLKEATAEAERGIFLEPQSAFAHYCLAKVWDVRNDLHKAMQSIDRAISILPENSHYHATRASLFCQMEKWQETLDAAETGLANDPEDEQCAAMRAIALERMGRVKESLSQANEMVRQSPDSTWAHASRGWAFLQSGDHRQAQESFREAIRLDPSSEMARSGMMQAINQSNFIFRWFFRLLMAMSRLDSRVQFGLIIGMWLVIQVLNGLKRAHPPLEPWVLPITITYFVLVLMSWILFPLFNTFLRFHPFGKHLLSRKEKWASNFIAGTLGLSFALAVIVAAIRREPSISLIPLILGLMMTLPISVVFQCEARKAIMIASLIAGLLGLLYMAITGLLLMGLVAPIILNTYLAGILLIGLGSPLLIRQSNRT